MPTVDATLVTAVSAILVALIGGIWSFVSGRKKAKADVQVTLNAGFEILIRELQEERKEMLTMIKHQADRIRELQALLETDTIQELQNWLEAKKKEDEDTS